MSEEEKDEAQQNALTLLEWSRQNQPSDEEEAERRFQMELDMVMNLSRSG